MTAIIILLPTSLNPRAGGRVIRVVGSIRGASLPRRSWYYGIAGAALLIASGSIHLDLYLTGYRSIPTIGWLFLLQIISAYALAIAIPVTRQLAGRRGRRRIRHQCPRRLPAVAKARPLRFHRGPDHRGHRRRDHRRRHLRRAGDGRDHGPEPGSPGPPSDRSRIRGRARADRCLRRHAEDAAGRDRRADAERQADRPREPAHRRQGPHALLVRPGQPEQVRLLRNLRRLLAAGGRERIGRPGVTGTIATIKRTDGTTQATYDGHPLYTYVGDSAPGQDGGNNLNLNGGLWHDRAGHGRVTAPGLSGGA